ncbi:hypothetical protein [Saccharothrix sp. Mg75]|uniref:hypothetical protein n=1 Tax=Saccharothrix sp. Mg75 TaxID=3445357 RepID=UPI003EE91C17
MEILPRQPSTKGPAEMFTGDVWFDVLAKGEQPSRMRVNNVRFAPGARTARHRHAVGRTLHVTEGVGLVQSRGGEVVEIRPGHRRLFLDHRDPAVVDQPGTVRLTD